MDISGFTAYLQVKFYQRVLKAKLEMCVCVCVCVYSPHQHENKEGSSKQASRHHLGSAETQRQAGRREAMLGQKGGCRCAPWAWEAAGGLSRSRASFLTG